MGADVDGDCVGDVVGVDVVGDRVGAVVVGSAVGATVGAVVGDTVGAVVVGVRVGAVVVGDWVGELVGSHTVMSSIKTDTSPPFNAVFSNVMVDTVDDAVNVYPYLSNCAVTGIVDAPGMNAPLTLIPSRALTSLARGRRAAMNDTV